MNWLSAKSTPSRSGLVVADTQGSIGFMLQQALNNDFRQRQIQREVHNHHHADAGGTKTTPPSTIHPSRLAAFWMKRRLAPLRAGAGRLSRMPGAVGGGSCPAPGRWEIIEIEAVRQAIEMGWVIVACGGGGISGCARRRRPTAGRLRGNRQGHGKQLAGGRIGRRSLSDQHRGGKGGPALWQARTDRSGATHRCRGQNGTGRRGILPPGSMQPKIDACIEFLENSNNPTPTA